MAAPGLELVTVETWLYLRLANNAVGVGDRVYADVAPRGAEFPLVIFQLQTPTDAMTANGTRIMTSGTWIVKAVMPAMTFTELSGIAALIDSRLHRKTYTSAGTGTVLACVREQPFKLVENADGLPIRHLGGMYKVFAQ